MLEYRIDTEECYRKILFRSLPIHKKYRSTFVKIPSKKVSIFTDYRFFSGNRYLVVSINNADIYINLNNSQVFLTRLKKENFI